MDGCGIVRTISIFVPVSLSRRCLAYLLMVLYIVYPIWGRAVSPCIDKAYNFVTVSGCEILTLVFEDVIQNLHLLTLGSAVDEGLWRYNCM